MDAVDDGRRTTDDGRRTTDDERRTTDDERQTTNLISAQWPFCQPLPARRSWRERAGSPRGDEIVMPGQHDTRTFRP